MRMAHISRWGGGDNEPLSKKKYIILIFYMEQPTRENIKKRSIGFGYVEIFVTLITTYLFPEGCSADGRRRKWRKELC